MSKRVHCAVPEIRSGIEELHLATGAGPPIYLHRVTAAMARGKRPATFRTRKLSLSAPMVLPWRRGGRVGRRRTTIKRRAPTVPGGGPSPYPRTPTADLSAQKSAGATVLVL